MTVDLAAVRRGDVAAAVPAPATVTTVSGTRIKKGSILSRIKLEDFQSSTKIEVSDRT